MAGAGAQALRIDEGPRGSQDEQLRQAAENYEAIVMGQLWAQMRKSGEAFEAGDGNPFAPSNGERIFQSMADDMMLKAVAARRPIGIADLVERQFRGEGGIGHRALIKSRTQDVRPAEQRTVQIPGG